MRHETGPAPSRRVVVLGAAAGLAPLAAGIAVAEERAPTAPTGHGLPGPGAAGAQALTADEKWARRFPQPVLVSDLIGRLMLDAHQGVLGWIQMLVRASDGKTLIAFARRRLLLFRGEMVVVPEHATALLGPFVMILDRTPAEIERLPVFDPAGMTPIDRTSTVRMALTKH